MDRGPGEDVLVGGSRGPPLGGRLHPPRRRHIAGVFVFLLGVALGGSSIHLWYTRPIAGESDIHLAGTLVMFHRYNDYAMATLTVYNLNDEPVTVYDADLDLPGLEPLGRHIWPGPPFPSIPGGQSFGIPVQFSADCSQDMGDGGAVFFASIQDNPRQRVRVRSVHVAPALRNYYRDTCPGSDT